MDQFPMVSAGSRLSKRVICRARPARRLRGVLVLTLAALLGIAAEARAANECGPPEARVEIVCSPSNYDPAGGNVYYGHDESGAGDFTIRLTEGLSINYDRDDPDDDVWVSTLNPEFRLYSAVWITPGKFADYTGDVSLYSSADVTSNTRGIFAGHYGESGALRMEISGGDITTTGEFGHAIRGFGDDNLGDVEMIVRDVTVATEGLGALGISSRHQGEGDMNLDVRGAAITTAGERASGIHGDHRGTGDVNLDVRGGAVTTEGKNALGLFAIHSGEGRLALAAQDVAIATAGDSAGGVYGNHRGTGDMNLDVRGGAVSTMGAAAAGVFGIHEGEGRLALAAQDVAIATAGDRAEGVYGDHRGTGDVSIDIRGGAIATAGDDAVGVYFIHRGTGDVNLDVRGGAITTAGEGARGIYGSHSFMEGDAAIRVQGGAVSTSGAEAFGVYGFHTGAGAFEIDLRETAVATAGEKAHGVVIDHGGSGSARIAVEGGSVHAAGTDASGIQIGRLHEDGTVDFAALPGEDGYRKQSVTVNGAVMGGSGANAAGVFLAGGGKVVIGPRGSLGAASGIAILTSGGAPRLHVSMNLDGRRMAEAIGDDWMINDGGETTLLVNGVTLHEGASGATGRAVLNGARDVTLRESETVRGRTFTHEDFTETYAPRAAVYEALPGLLLRLHSRGPAGERLTAPGSPAWVRVAGGAGRYTPVQASVGAKYDFHRVEVEAGLDVELGPRLTGTLSVRHVQGSGDVSSPTGGGEINARGLGGAIGVAWAGPQGYYFQGRVSVIDYDVDLVSDTRGTLTEDASALGHSLGFETGRRFTLSERLTLTPRVWVTRSKISLDVTDAVQSRLSTKDSDRLAAGTGLVAETERVWDDGTQAFAVRGALDLWRTLGDGTALNVSQGAPLKSVSDKTRVLISLGGVYRWGRFSVSSDVALGGLGSRDQEYAGLLNLGIQF